MEKEELTQIVMEALRKYDEEKKTNAKQSMPIMAFFEFLLILLTSVMAVWIVLFRLPVAEIDGSVVSFKEYFLIIHNSTVDLNGVMLSSYYSALSGVTSLLISIGFWTFSFFYSAYKNEKNEILDRIGIISGILGIIITVGIYFGFI